LEIDEESRELALFIPSAVALKGRVLEVEGKGCVGRGKTATEDEEEEAIRFRVSFSCFLELRVTTWSETKTS
jgi:hypothetical protein